MLSVIFNILGISLMGIGWYAHIEWWKSTAAFVIGAYIMLRNHKFREKRLNEEDKQRKLKTQMMEEALRRKKFSNYIDSNAGEEDEF